MPKLLKDPQGNPVWVANDQVNNAIDQGFTAENTASEDLTKEDRGTGGVVGAGVAGVTSALSGATLGASDIALKGLLTKGGLRDVASSREEHPIISTGANIIGATLPAILSGGASDLGSIASLARATPAGQIGRIGAKIVGLGEEAGAIGQAGYTAAAGAFEGAAQNAGGYISDVALGDRDLSADGFLGAMGKGALYGGVAGGALSVASNGLIAARKLIPAIETTPEAVARAEYTATKAIRESVEDSVSLEQTARQELEKVNAVTEPLRRGAADLEEAGSLARKDIPAEALLADRFRTIHEPAPSWVESPAPSQPLIKYKEPIQPAYDWRTGKAFAAEETPAVVPADDLMSQLVGTKASLDAGKQLREVASAASGPAQKLESAVHEMAAARTELLDAIKGPESSPVSLAEKILKGPEPGPDEVIAKALGKSADVNADIAQLAPKITRYEAARAEVTEALGPKAPPEAASHASAFRAAQQKAETSSARQTAQAAENVGKMTDGAPAKILPGGSALKGIAGKAANAGAAYEMLRSLGVPLPDVKNIPVVGPLLSLFLKAKLVSKIAGKFGGSFAATAEGTIAAKATQTINRVHASIDTMLAGTKAATAAIGQPAAALGHKLFDENVTRAPYKSDPELDDLGNIYQARMQELIAAMRPGAIEQAIRARVVTSDPTIVDAIVAAETRKATYLYNAAPKPDAPLLPGQPQWTPPKSEITDFGIVVAAAHDPAEIFERVAAGGIARPSEVECIKNCYPALYAEGQKQLIQRLAKSNAPLSYSRRVAISMLTGVPMDVSLVPGRVAIAQATPPTPHPSMSVNLGQRTATRLDGL